MSRRNAQTYKCINCGNEVANRVICYDCEYAEIKNQRQEKGSITQQQVWFMEKKILPKLDNETTTKIFFSIVPDWNYDMEELSTQQGKDLIARFLEVLNEDDEPAETAA